MDRLAVSVSEGTLHEVAAPDTFETDGPFVVALSNRGRGSHVHLRLDDELARVATLAETNPHVPRDETVEIVADVDAVSAPVAGLLTIETGYGADGAEVEVTVAPPATTQRQSESTSHASDGGTPTAQPAPPEPSDDDATDPTAAPERLSTDDGPNLLTLAVALLAVGAVGVAVGAATLVTDPVVVVGAAAAVLAVGLAVFLLVR